MKKNKNNFIRNMIIAASVGFGLLMVMMILGIKYYLGGRQNSTVVTNSIIETETPQVEFTDTILILVTDINKDEISGLDIDKKIKLTKRIAMETTINDAHGGAVPLDAIHKGDIVEVVYQEDKEEVLSISKTAKAFALNSVNKVTVDTEHKEINVNGKKYTYNDDLLVLRGGTVETSLSFIGKDDVVSIQGKDDVIWSINIEKIAATIQLTDLPTSDGQLEIDRTTIVQFRDMKKPISISPGEHKLVIQMEFYNPIIEKADIKQGEAHTISLKGAQRAYSKVIPQVNAPDYKITIGNVTYKKGDSINISQGNYNVAVDAEGYLPWRGKVKFNKATHNLKISLTAKEEKKEETENLSEENTESDSSTKQSYTINISTDPVDAKVYIDGVYKGVTPYKVTLPLGDYAILLEKDDYEVYTTSIILDGSNNQNSFLYVLTPKS